MVPFTFVVNTDDTAWSDRQQLSYSPMCTTFVAAKIKRELGAIHAELSVLHAELGVLRAELGVLKELKVSSPVCQHLESRSMTPRGHKSMSSM